jgi:hypothetical protein
MANLTLRQVKGSPLTIAELDGNFEYFTGSHAITGSLIVTGGITGSISGDVSASYVNPLEQDVQLTGSLTIDEGYFANFPTNSINLTIPSGYNALLIGPIFNTASINVSTGSRLVIL